MMVSCGGGARGQGQQHSTNYYRPPRKVYVDHSLLLEKDNLSIVDEMAASPYVPP